MRRGGAPRTRWGPLERRRRIGSDIWRERWAVASWQLQPGEKVRVGGRGSAREKDGIPTRRLESGRRTRREGGGGDACGEWRERDADAARAARYRITFACFCSPPLRHTPVRFRLIAMGGLTMTCVNATTVWPDDNNIPSLLSLRPAGKVW
jgi:hypothetical protein